MHPCRRKLASASSNSGASPWNGGCRKAITRALAVRHVDVARAGWRDGRRGGGIDGGPGLGNAWMGGDRRDDYLHTPVLSQQQRADAELPTPRTLPHTPPHPGKRNDDENAKEKLYVVASYVPGVTNFKVGVICPFFVVGGYGMARSGSGRDAVAARTSATESRLNCLLSLILLIHSHPTGLADTGRRDRGVNVVPASLPRPTFYSGSSRLRPTLFTSIFLFPSPDFLPCLFSLCPSCVDLAISIHTFLPHKNPLITPCPNLDRGATGMRSLVRDCPDSRFERKRESVVRCRAIGDKGRRQCSQSWPGITHLRTSISPFGYLEVAIRRRRTSYARHAHLLCRIWSLKSLDQYSLMRFPPHGRQAARAR